MTNREEGGTTAGFSTASQSLVTAMPRDRLPPLPALTILCHPDLDRVGDRVLLGELVAGREALLSRHQPHFAAPGSSQGRPLGDPFLSREPLRLEPLADGGVRIHRGRSRAHLEVDGAAVEDTATIAATEIKTGTVVELARRLVLLLHRRPAEVADTEESFGLVGGSAELARVRAAIARVADLEVSVLLRGETGTGKELVAEALHDHSPRRGGPFVAVNVGALTPSLAAAELFGAVKGAYTGAGGNRPGCFGRAEGGTLFLDEIGEAPPELQVALLRAVETGTVTAVGSSTPRPVNVRIISATDADLESLIAEGGFRAPLLHRLAGYSIHLQPLRRRRDDFGLLLVHFLRREQASFGEWPPSDPADRRPWLPATLVARLARHSWPGNVRQLRNVARQLVIDGRGRQQLTVSPELEALLPETEKSVDASKAPAEGTSELVDETPAPRSRRRRKPSDVSEDQLIAALRTHRWNLKEAAAELGIPRTSLYSLLERSPRIRAAADVPPDEIRRAHARWGDDLEAMVDELEISERALRQRLKDLGLR